MTTAADLQFSFAAPGRIIFRCGSLHSVAEHAAALGSRALLVCSPRNPHARAAAALLDTAHLLAAHWHVSNEPSTDDIRAGVRCARDSHADVIVALGGGSVIDAAKAIAAFLTNPGDIYDYLETVGRALPLAHPPLPSLAVPTTAGSGAEVTFNAVLYAPEHHVKVSLRHPQLAPRIVLVDPALTVSLPPEITAATGMDALTQLIEAFVSHAANPLTDMFCREGLTRAARALPRAYAHGDDLAPRADMSFAAMLSGLALANAKLGAVHGLAGPLGGLLRAPHGAICGRLLPFVMLANIAALRNAHTPSATAALARFAHIARLTGAGSTPEDAAAWASHLSATLNIPPLASLGLTPALIPAVIPHALNASSMKGNPIPLSPAQLHELLSRAL